MLLAAKNIEKGSKPGFGGWSRNPLEDVTFYHHDALGSVVMLTNDKGHVVESYQYDVYGNAYNGKFTSLGKNSGQGSIFGSGNGYGYGSGKSTNVYGFTGKRYTKQKEIAGRLAHEGTHASQLRRGDLSPDMSDYGFEHEREAFDNAYKVDLELSPETAYNPSDEWLRISYGFEEEEDGNTDEKEK